jgi:assimilatory nitrate reductase catalytic subunit
VTRTTCPYCGVGCGVVAQDDGSIVGDTLHPANRGRLCSKGAALAETLDDGGRLLHPMLAGRPVGWDTALDEMAARFGAAIAEHGPDSVALYVSGQCLTEDYYVANKLMKGFIGSANIDTNSRLCMASSVAGHTRAFGADVVPGVYADVEEADLVVLVGSNLAWCHPVLHQRLMAARARRGTRIVVVDPRRTATSDQADLHLALAPGSDVALFNALLAHLEAAGALDRAWIAAHTSGFEAALSAARADAAATSLAPADIRPFLDWFAATDRVVTIYSQGVNQSAAGTDKVNAILNCHLATGRIGKPGAGPFSVTGQPNAMGGREVGGLANQLAAHMRLDDRAAIDRVRRFWSAPRMATTPGLKAIELFEAARDGRIKALWIVATNPAASLPRSDLVRDALRACPFVVVSDCWPTDTTRLADLVLPAAGWGEKDGTVTNSERIISRQRPFRAAPGEARADWRVMADFARRLGFGDGFTWQGPAAVFREHAALSGFENGGTRVFDISGLAGLDDAGYAALAPVQWPVPADGSAGGRLFSAGGFPTPDGRARFVPIAWRGPVAPLDADFPLLLNTGRVRDQWHTMTRTGQVPRLMGHAPAPALAVAPADASALGLVDGDLARIVSRHGETVLRVSIASGQRHGEAFAPMHWTDDFAASGPVGRVVGGDVDPHSGQPELKATPVRVAKVPTFWRGLLLRRHAAVPAAPGLWWSRVPLDGGQAFELAGTSPLPQGAALGALVAGLLAGDGAAERIELADPARGAWRIATLRDGRLDACLFLSTGAVDLPGREALAALMRRPVPDSGRAALLAGRFGAGAAERTVCACFAVGLGAIRAAIASARLATVEEIGAAIGAGSNCGSCIPELKEILRDAHADAA